jgi:hypothetical protein
MKILLLILIFIFGSFFCALIGVSTDAGFYPLLFATVCIFMMLYKLRENFTVQNKVFKFILSITLGALIGSAFMAVYMGIVYFFFTPGDKFPLILIFNILAGTVIGGIANGIYFFVLSQKINTQQNHFTRPPLRSGG